ncbi:sensor domain-containing diguanylate cyclase [Lichenihabitans sp. Uapishka_5]|uniref:GGDEF domain-containing protein n=1 Tax=Lichenihabitans sp. Uapishka_5 TaxID=3037302 RepID=UPI0029E8109F|nr:sensor domain-containing diguanylate cyclase [Lichenihabitans sp. Uapishka_5]MDX7953838.1 sensor domain-containing diguanylate cyclase [Lichenihabitans sp. Uapishka_5]
MIIALICGGVAVLARAAWVSDSARASVEAGNLTTLIAQDVQRNIDRFDFAIQGARDAVAKPSVMAAPVELRDAVLFGRAATTAFLDSVTILDAAGHVVASSRQAQATLTSEADRDYFRIHALMPDFGLFVSRPITSRQDGEQVVALSRRVTLEDGSFGGVVVGMLRLDYLRQMFGQTPLGPHGSLSLFRTDGTLMVRQPFDPALLGQRLMSQKLINALSRSDEGEYQGASAIDGAERLYHYRRLDRLPLVINVGLSVADIHAAWLPRTALIGIVVALSCGSMILVTRLLGHELRRRVEAEAALLKLVDADGLTGLANRRCFDRVLAERWQQGLDAGRPLSLLMIDADHFKPFNDLFGHTAGDEALRQIARCLDLHAQREGELAVRYGGEEFAMILPNVGVPEAARIAERVRRSVSHLRVAHPGSPHGHLTVSIGCATADPVLMSGCADLATAADEALYRCKYAGRDKVLVSGMAA